ncbi:uncharacterized protein LOC110706214 isoform X1 [Chenopodium quinoa]|uniref:uncharacterized protein LOC110706214 isoform X1 n=1 Tax=Chenopodium quinoa TaxID=63459 RepID=UPI000B786D3B|nr:uncharacterized protein LOC110706214 isoform X1 [Chenopodium quinoa]
MFQMIHDALGHPDDNPFDKDDMSDDINISSNSHKEPKKPSLTHEQFEKLIKDAEQQLYPGCNGFSKLSFVVNLFQIKCVNGLSNKAFTNILQLVKKALPEGNNLPTTYHDSKKIIQDLGLSYEKIDACENDCMLYWKENESLETCKVCGLSRWKVIKNVTKNHKKIPRKVLRYFPLKPRLQRLFMSSDNATDLRWHSEGRVKDEILRHPADSEAWKTLNKIDPTFNSDPRDIRLGLASDGFNPFGQQRSDYITWPVVLSVYNFPPWMFTKQPYLMLSLLIPGPKAPGNNIDVYLRPLIDELKDLWECGIETYDASKKEYFVMRSALLWTINDFPAYANLSGWSTKGYMACPTCGKGTSSFRLPNCRKICYMDYRCFLPLNHKWRDSKTFDGKVERRPAPKPLPGDEMLAQMSGLEDLKFGKDVKHPKRADNWRKISIFFELPYWSRLLLRHNLDVMHIEKNVFDNILGTLLDIRGKSKDHIKARHDLKELRIRKKLHPKLINGKWHIPPAMYTLSPGEKDKVCKFLEEVKVPDGYSSIFSKCIKKRKVSGLKTHDCHVLLQQLLPLAIRGISCQQVYDLVVELGIFFQGVVFEIT